MQVGRTAQLRSRVLDTVSHRRQVGSHSPAVHPFSREYPSDAHSAAEALLHPLGLWRIAFSLVEGGDKAARAETCIFGGMLFACIRLPLRSGATHPARPCRLSPICFGKQPRSPLRAGLFKEAGAESLALSMGLQQCAAACRSGAACFAGLFKEAGAESLALSMGLQQCAAACRTSAACFAGLFKEALAESLAQCMVLQQCAEACRSSAACFANLCHLLGLLAIPAKRHVTLLLGPLKAPLPP